MQYNLKINSKKFIQIKKKKKFPREYIGRIISNTRKT